MSCLTKSTKFALCTRSSVYVWGMSKKVFCEVCATCIPSAALLETHNKGKKHQRLLKVQEHKEKVGRRSVYVRNFEVSPTIEEDLNQHFSCYGDVKNVFLDKEEGVYAIVEFEAEESVAKVLGDQGLPALRGRKLRVKARTVLKKQTANSPPSSLPEGRPHPEAEHLLAPFLDEELITKIGSVSLVSEQVSILEEGLKLREDDLRLRQLICDLLQEVFKEAFPQVQVVPFGSTVTGLGWRGSDLDVCLLTDSPEMLSGGVAGASHVTEVANQEYSFIIDVLRRLTPGCVRVIPVLSAKCPLIRFTHQPSGLACDLTINNRLGICNSELLKCYTSLDARVKLLVFAVRGWAKAKGVRDKCLLSNYALTLMVLYFLQSTTSPVIPSLQEPGEWLSLKSSAIGSVPVKDDQSQFAESVIDGWNCTYLSDVRHLLPSKNVKTLDQLLGEFFSFYESDFDYGNCVVNIKTGRRTTVAEVLQELSSSTTFGPADFQLGSKSLQMEKHQKFKVTPLCVQDPFELTHNVAQSVSATALKQFIQLVTEAKAVCEDSLAKDSKASFLKLLLVPKRMKKKKLPSYSFTVPLHQQESSDAGKMNARSVLCAVVKMLQEDFGLVCEVHNSGATGLTAQRVSGNSEGAQAPCEVIPHENQQVDEDVDPAAGETSSSRVKRKADDMGGAAEQPAKKARCNEVKQKHGATCTAWKNTWRSHRKEKRQQRNAGSTLKGSSIASGTTAATNEEAADPASTTLKGKLSDGHNATEGSLPVIVFKLTASSTCERDLHSCTLHIESVFSSDPQVLGNFFGVFKKHILSHLAQGRTT